MTIFGHRKGSEWFGYFSEYRGVTGIREKKYMGLIGLRGEGEAGRAPPPQGLVRIGLGGGAAPFLVSYSYYMEGLLVGLGKGESTPGGSRTPLGRAIERAGPPLLHSFIYGGRGTP